MTTQEETQEERVPNSVHILVFWYKEACPYILNTVVHEIISDKEKHMSK